MNLLLLALVINPFAAAHSPRHLTSSQSLHLHSARSTCARNIHCILAKEAVEGPFYIPHPLIRANITEDRDGIPFSLTINVLNTKNCSAATGVYVDIWHADAMGEYSGWASNSLLSASSHVDASGTPIEASRWLRGVQKTDGSGIARFDTVMPGWYYGRSTHIHVRMHNGNVTLAEHGMVLDGGKVAHTGQFFFGDELVKEVSRTREPYVTHRKKLLPRMNGDDGIFLDSDGGEQIVDVSTEESVWRGEVTVGIDVDADYHESPRPPRFGPDGRVWLRGALAGIFAIFALWYGAKTIVRLRKGRRGYKPLRQVGDDGRAQQTDGRAGYGSM